MTPTAITAGLFRIDATTRGQGVKCGNGYISKGEKCKSGAGGAVTTPPRGKASRGAKAAQIAGGIGNAVSIGMAYKNAFQGDFKKAGRWNAAGAGFNALHGAGKLSEGKATGNTKMVNKAKNQLRGAAVVGGLSLAMSGDLRRAANIPKDVVTGYNRAQTKRYRNMSEEEYSSAARAAGNPEGPSQRWSQRKGSVNTTARAVPAGLLRGATGKAPNRKARTSTNVGDLRDMVQRATAAAKSGDSAAAKAARERLRNQFNQQYGNK